eukprot:g15007.t1
MFGYYRENSLLVSVALSVAPLGVACTDDMQRVSSWDHSRGGHEHLRLLHKDTNDGLVGPVAGARRSISAARPVGGGDSSQEQFHSSPDQRRRTQSSRAESTPIDITSSLSSDAEGCYYLTEVVVDGLVEIIYTPSGEPVVGQSCMHPDKIAVNGLALPTVALTLTWRRTTSSPSHTVAAAPPDSSALETSPAPVADPTVVPTIKATSVPTATVEMVSTPSPSIDFIPQLTPAPSKEDPTPSPAAALVPEETPEPTPGSRGLDTPARTVQELPRPLDLKLRLPRDLLRKPPSQSVLPLRHPRTEVVIDDGLVEIIYTPSGEPEVRHWWMHPDKIAVNGVKLPTVYWWLSFATAVDEDGGVTSSEDLCKSNQAATSNTPADVISWDCGTSLDQASSDVFSVTCGGSCTGSSTLEPETSPTPTPAVETVEPTEAEAPELTEAPMPNMEETPASTAGNSGLETPPPTVAYPDSPDSADLVLSDTPALFGVVDGEAASSAVDRRVSWTVFHAGVIAGVATVIALL